VSSSELDTSLSFTPRFDANGLMPVVTVDAKDGAVLMLAYMNRAALDATIATKQATYWSRSRQALWRKGETSGHTQRVVSLKVDCDRRTDRRRLPYGRAELLLSHRRGRRAEALALSAVFRPGLGGGDGVDAFPTGLTQDRIGLFLAIGAGRVLPIADRLAAAAA
jgi:phosphoribosyl-AMP cyclohydrolase